MNGPMAWDMECFVTPQTMNAVLSDRLFEIKKRHADAFSWLDGQQAAMVDQVIAWSKINSGSGNLDGLRRMGETLEDAFAKTGADCTLLPLSPVRMISLKGEDQSLELGPCRLFSIRPQAPRRILLTGHIDTVFAADHPFQTPRWLDDQTLNGPGVADMKGGLIVMLHALLAVERSGAWEDFDFSDFGWDVLISADEEIGSLGSAAYLAERAAFARIGLTYEPALADGTLAGARKGSGNFSFVVRGRAAHAGREFALGRNAVVMMAELITQLDALNGQRSGVTINPAVIAGGAAPNIVPDSAVLRFNVRVESDADAQWVREGSWRSARISVPGKGFRSAFMAISTVRPSPSARAIRRCLILSAPVARLWISGFPIAPPAAVARAIIWRPQTCPMWILWGCAAVIFTAPMNMCWWKASPNAPAYRLSSSLASPMGLLMIC